MCSLRPVIFGFLIILLAVPVFAQDYDAYNLEVELPAKYLSVAPGSKIFFTTKIINLASESRKDIILQYSLRRGASDVASKTETVAIETQASFVGSVVVPEKSSLGEYLLIVEVIDENGAAVSTSESKFTVSPEENFLDFFVVHWKLSLGVLSAFIILLLLFFCRKRIASYFEHKGIRARVSKIISGKMKKGRLSQDDLLNSRLPTEERQTNARPEDKIY